MVLTVLRIGAKKALGLVPARICILQNATLTGRSTRGGPLKLRDGFPWEKKKISYLRCWWDETKHHVTEENARLIVVDGPIAAGKSALAKTLAEEFDMRYFPEPNMDEYWINTYGFDLRTLDHKLPDHLQSYDEKVWCMNPTDIRKSALFQLQLYQLRYFTHVDALTHILNTGQGAVMERNYFSDRVFAQSMLDEGHITKPAKDYYDRFTFNTHWTLMKPHVVIYLDVPVPVVQERIKTRNLSWEVNGKALTPSFLQNMEKYYKLYLKEMSEHSDLLVYDWSEGGEVESVVEDLEELREDEIYNVREKKYADWKISRSALFDRRILYTNKVLTELMMNFYALAYDCDELWYDPDDVDLLREVFKSVKGQKYDPGYNKDVGDNYYFKWWDKSHRRPVFHVFQEEGTFSPPT